MISGHNGGNNTTTNNILMNQQQQLQISSGNNLLNQPDIFTSATTGQSLPKGGVRMN